MGKLENSRFTLENLITSLDRTIGRLKTFGGNEERVKKYNAVVLRARLAMLQTPTFAGEAYGQIAATEITQ